MPSTAADVLVIATTATTIGTQYPSFSAARPEASATEAVGGVGAATAPAIKAPRASTPRYAIVSSASIASRAHIGAMSATHINRPRNRHVPTRQHHHRRVQRVPFELERHAHRNVHGGVVQDAGLGQLDFDHAAVGSGGQCAVRAGAAAVKRVGVAGGQQGGQCGGFQDRAGALGF